MYLGPGLDLAPHLNVATTIAAALEQPFALRTWTPAGHWSPWRPALVSVIPASTLHHLKARGPMAFLYLDPLNLSDDTVSLDPTEVSGGDSMPGRRPA